MRTGTENRLQAKPLQPWPDEAGTGAEHLPAQSVRSLYWLIVPLALCVFLLDVGTSLHVVGGMPYVAVILVALYSQDRTFVLHAALGCTALAILGFVWSPDLGGAGFGQALTSRCFGLAMVWLSSGLSFRAPASLPRQARFPTAVLAAAMCLNLLVAAGLGWIFLNDKLESAASAERSVRITELRGRILHYDEILTMSARMAAATGSVHWEDRYRRYEAQLDAALLEANRHVPEASQTAGAAKTALANTALVNMENEAFALVRGQRSREALAVLDSAEYHLHKRRYAEGMDELNSMLLQNVEAYRTQDERRTVVYSVMIALIAALTLAVWVVASRAIARWRYAEACYRDELRAHVDALAHLDTGGAGSTASRAAKPNQHSGRENSQLPSEVTKPDEVLVGEASDAESLISGFEFSPDQEQS